MKMNQANLIPILNQLVNADVQFTLTQVKHYNVVDADLMVTVKADITDSNALAKFISNHLKALDLADAYDNETDLRDALFEAMCFAPDTFKIEQIDGLDVDDDMDDTIETEFI